MVEVLFWLVIKKPTAAWKECKDLWRTRSGVAFCLSSEASE